MHPQPGSTSDFIRDLGAVLLGTVGTKRDPGSRQLGLDDAIFAAYGFLKEAKENRRTVFALGNGGSQVVAQHVEMDLANRACMRARSFSSTPVVTALCNDHSHEEAYQRLLGTQADRGDLLLAISSSGASRNILAAARAARKMGMKVVTFSGFDADNPLRSAGDLNLWVDSKEYGLVELAHETLVHRLSDLCVAAEEAGQVAEAAARAAARGEARVVVGAGVLNGNVARG